MKLVQLEGERRLRSHALRDGETVLGRDASADVVVPDRRASRRHALIEPYEAVHSIRDLESANGTTVNGHSITTPVLLTPGDVIEVGDTRYSYEEGGAFVMPSWLVPAAIAAVVVIGLGLGAYTLWPAGGGSEASVLALEAIEASRGERPQEAKRALNGAIALLIGSGALDDVAPKDTRRIGLKRLQEELGTDVDLLAIYDSAVDGARREARRQAEPKSGPRRGPCRTDNVSERDLGLCIRERAEKVLVDLWQDPREIPESFYGAVDEQFRLVLSRRRGWVEGALARGRKLRPMMDKELEAAKMPSMLRYLSMIESGYQPKIKSKAGARGLWQFMPRTGRAYGLKVTSTVDERTDPRKSTRAAARYLRDLAFEFGGDALLLAIASYNKGENGIRRALKKLDDPRTDRSYWALVQRELLPKETQDYVPRLIAAAIMGEAGLPPESVLPPS